MNNRDDSFFTQERIVTVSGTSSTCAKCISLIINILNDNLSDAQYVNNSTRYTTHMDSFHGHAGAGARRPGRNNNSDNYSAGSPYAKRSNDRGTGDRRQNDRGHSHTNGTGGESNDILEDVITSTKIALTVPDNMIGNILGM